MTEGGAVQKVTRQMRGGVRESGDVGMRERISTVRRAPLEGIL